MKKYNKEFIIGLCVIIAGLVLFFGIDYLKGINLLNPTHFYYAEATDVSGLEKSAPVTVNGFKVGQVRSIKYDYDHPGKIKILLAVNDKLNLPEDSYAQLASSLLNGGYINLVVGKSAKLIPNGGLVRLRSEKGIMDAVSNDLVPNINKMVPHIDSLINNLNDLVSDPALIASIRRLDGITENVLTMTGDLQGTVKRDVPPLMHNARNLTHKLDSVSYNLMLLSHNLNQLPINSTMDNVYKITDELSRFSTQLNEENSTLGLLTKDPELYNRLNRVAADIDSLVLDVKKNPKRYISIKLF